MRTSINQNRIPLSLPELRNLGTILRILLLVNAIVMIAAFVREEHGPAISDAWVQMSAAVEPHLLLELLILYLLAPWLERAPYTVGAASVLAVTLAVGLAWNTALAALGPEITTRAMLRHVMFSLLIAGVLLIYFQLRAKALSPAITEARLQALQARIRPHFLFNSITAVLSLMRSEPRRAEAALEDLADLFRVLMRDNRQLAPLSDEVELCRQYLELEKLRLGDRLTIEWHIDNMPGDAQVPPLVLQPLLENAVYHGIEPSSAPGVIAINIFLRRGEVHAILRNPYKMNHSNKDGNKMALANIRERLALHFDAEASLESKTSRDTYEVHIRMPYRTYVEPEEAHE
jgi:two-component system, LytTR family, sensor histidine kinase AlgZ